MIGVYDSGFGGLTVLRHLRRALPTHDFCYLGDSGRAPYGGRDPDTLLDFAEQCVERLFFERCRLIVVACHTVSCVALRHLQGRYSSDTHRVLGVTIPGAEAAVARSRGHIGIIGTAATIASGTWLVEIGKLGPHRVTQRAAPLLAPLVEEGWEDTEIARLAVARYCQDFTDIDTLVLGCTHYPLLAGAFTAALPGVALVDPSSYVADRLVDWLARHPGFDAPGRGDLRVLCTGDPDSFVRHGTRFLGEPIAGIGHVREEAGRLVVGTHPVQRGQFVRG